MLQFDWQRHYCGYFTSTACVTDQTRRATRAGSGIARLGRCSVSADENKILIITIQAAKH